MATKQDQPTAEDMHKATAVSTAGAEAAAGAENPEDAEKNAAEAMKAKRDEVGFKMSDEDIEAVAKKLSSFLTSDFEERGAFQAAPERVEAVQPEVVAPAPRDTPPAPGEDGVQVQAPMQPQKQTWAQKFMGS